MITLALELGIVILVPLALASQLITRMSQRSGLRAGPLWIIAHVAGGAAIFGLSLLVLVQLTLPAALAPDTTLGMLFHVSFVELAKFLALLALSSLIATPLCGCPDDDEPVVVPPTKKSSWDPFYTAPPPPWHGPTAFWTVGGFVLGSSFSALENLSVATDNLYLLLLRQVGPLVLHGASAALIAWGLARFRAGQRKNLGAAGIVAVALHFSYNLMVTAAFPWPLLSWFLIPPAYVVLWRYAGNTVAVRRPRKKRNSEDCD